MQSMGGVGGNVDALAIHTAGYPRPGLPSECMVRRVADGTGGISYVATSCRGDFSWNTFDSQSVYAAPWPRPSALVVYRGIWKRN